MSTTILSPGGGDPYLLCMIADITAAKESEAALQHLALHDPLTGLPNRRALAEHLAAALPQRRAAGQLLGVLYLDLDGFKTVNDTLGHTAGDELLGQVAQRLSACVRSGDVVARLGGDEFAVLCPSLTGPADLTQLAERILAAVAQPVLLSEGTAHVTTSIGATLAGEDADPEALLHRADAAMYEAKHAGKGCLVSAG